MERTPDVTTPEKVQHQSGYQSLQPVTRPPYAGADLDPARRPGVARTREEPHPFPNTRFPVERMTAEPASPKHGRPNKPMPPVFGTVVPLHGLAGAVRKFAYRLPDHYPSHWLLMMFGDRVESWGTRVRRLLPLALPLVALGVFGRRALRA